MAEVAGAAGVAGVARVAGAVRVTKAAGHRLCPLTSVLAKSVFFSPITGKEYTFPSAHLCRGN